MRIVADRAIPCIKEFFQPLGELILLDGSGIRPSHLAGADVLVTRTVTRVDEDLLKDTGVKLVASATSGRDHVDLEYLHHNGIGFVHAPGCNARSVAEYVVSCLFALARRDGFFPTDKSVGIIGRGHVGATVLHFLKALGMRCLVYDPPLEEAGGEGIFHELSEVLSCDIISLHTPLIDGGPWPTRHLVDRMFLSRVKPDVILINTARGGVIDESALEEFLDSAPESTAVLDVWQNEPEININLVKKSAIATAHIAGYSTDGRVRCTGEVYKRVCRYFNTRYNAPVILPSIDNENNIIELDETTGTVAAVQTAVLSSYDVRFDSESLASILSIGHGQRKDFFLSLRNDYRVRREFTSRTVLLPVSSGELGKMLGELGFRTATKAKTG